MTKQKQSPQFVTEVISLGLWQNSPAVDVAELEAAIETGILLQVLDQCECVEREEVVSGDSRGNWLGSLEERHYGSCEGSGRFWGLVTVAVGMGAEGAPVRSLGS